MTASLTSTDTAPDGLELPRPPGVVRRFLAEHPVLVDTAVAGIYFVPSMLFTIVGQIMAPTTNGAIAIGLVVIATVALFFRRQRPGAVFALATGVLVASVLLSREVDFLPTLFALYALAVYRSARSAWIGLAITAAVTIASLIGLQLLRHSGIYPAELTEPTGTGFFVLATSVVSVLIGNNIGSRRRYLAALIDRARQLARERDQQAVIAASAERSRIAREMHDIVSHSLTVMITLSEGSARLAESAPARSAETMRLVADTGRTALGDMRRLLGVLRSGDPDSAEHQPQPGVGELTDLIETFRAAGLPVRISVTGLPPADVGQQLTVFRVVQEGLTNALRYGSLADSVDVAILFRSDRIAITIEDDAAVHGEAVEGSGRGLIGLRERVALYGGTLDAGPRTPAGWRIHTEFDTVALPPAPSTIAAPAAARGAAEAENDPAPTSEEDL
jgi:signal transduction histidine kinase